MIERIGDIFNQPDADMICFTSNGVVKDNGELVMGAGIAKVFRDRYPGVAKYFGGRVLEHGNHVYHHLYKDNLPFIASFPTKNHWAMPSDISLIHQSAEELKDLTKFLQCEHVYLTRPGCGLGGLNWHIQVRPVLAPILDDRFVVLTPR